MSKKTIAQYWEDIFNDYDIINKINQNGFYEINADTIKEYKKEPRLMTKFDFSKDLPTVFSDNNLAILPVDNGIYRIGKYKLYQKLPKYNGKVKETTLPIKFETIDPDDVYSEANALHIAYLAGMFDELLNEKLYQTISGRKRAEGFNFCVDVYPRGKQQITVYSPQMEIDGGYEGLNNILIVEAKNKLPKDFIVRQLFYPYRHWKNKVNKQISTFFFVYDSGNYYIYDYSFTNENDYNSLRLKSKKAFSIRYSNSKEVINKVLKKKPSIKDKNVNIQFPQANSISVIFQCLVDLKENDLSAKEIANNIGYTTRQGSYYGDALIYLGLAEKKQKKYHLNQNGNKIAKLTGNKRNAALAKEIVKHDTFYECAKYVQKNSNSDIPKAVVKNIMKKTKVKLPNEKTLNRRASTTKGWIDWMFHAYL